MQPKVYIVAGAVQTGKTTALTNWCATKKLIEGVLTPVINGKRMLQDVATKELFELEAMPSETDVLAVGRFVFKKSIFLKANNLIANASSYCLIIDEIGPLELRKEGLFNSIEIALQSASIKIIVLVVRATLVDEMQTFFSIKNATIITKEGLQMIPYINL